MPINPTIIISLLAAWCLSLFGVGWWQRSDGETIERAAWQTRENSELRTANSRILTLEKNARQTEREKAEAVAAISINYERKLSDANKQRAADAAALRAGTLRLRDPGASGLCAGGSVTAETTASAGQRDGGAAGELSAESAGFLLGLAADADDVARQLAACQQVIVADRGAGSH